MLTTFPKGVHPDSKKTLTDKLHIEIMPTPDKVYIPMLQHAGEASVPVVKGGDTVITGQLIGQAAGRNGVNVYSSCCGSVRTVEERATSRGKCAHVVIENNGRTDTAHLPPLNDPSPEQIKKRVADCGISGMGGAGFSTSVKLTVNNRIDELLINGAECEPYITCDHRVMVEYTPKFVSGALLMQKALGAQKVIIGVENNKADAIHLINQYITQNSLSGITVAPLKVKYPQGGDKQLIFSLTGKKIAKGVRSSSRGVVVSNVHTAFSVYLAVREGRQCYSRVMTVTGKGITSPKNMWVPNGALYKDIIEFCGGVSADNPPVKIISGGPMMGQSVYSTEIAAGKTTSCLLLLSKSEAFTGRAGQCINCGRCARVCPMNLMPMYIDAMAQSDFIEDTERYGISYCIECGSCAYVCPAKRNLVQSILLAKSALKQMERSTK